MNENADPSRTAPPLPDVAVEVVGLNKWYGEFHVLRDINLKVARGERIVICGPSGGGKSTLLRCVNRLEDWQQGRIIVDGIELTEDPKQIVAVRRDVGMVFQHFNLFPHLTVLENCTLAPMWVRHMPKKEAEALAMNYLARVKIPDQAGKYPARLSGGQQQRVAIARALCMNPDIMLFDESRALCDPVSAQRHYMQRRARDDNRGRSAVRAGGRGSRDGFRHVVLHSQPVADAGFGEDVRGVLRFGLDLLAKLTHVYPQILHVARPAPNLLHEKPVREDFTRMKYELPQDVIFLRRKLHLLALDGDDAADEVGGQIAALEKRLAALLLEAVAQCGADARDKLRDAERLCDIIVRAKIQGLDLAALARSARQDDDRHLRTAGTHAAYDVQTVQIGKTQIEDRDFGFGAGDERERLLGVLGLDHLEAFSG